MQISFKGVLGPTSPYEGPICWPSMENPNIVVLSQYYGDKETVLKIEQVLPIDSLEFVDKSLG